jgi:glycosyltransferase involved in cell wall biosynthesis
MPRVIGPDSALREAPTVMLELARQPIRTLAVLAKCVTGLWRRPMVLLKTLVSLWRGMARLPELRRFDAELLHAHWATYPSTTAWALGRLLRRPFSFTCHAHDIFVEDQMLRLKLAEARLVATISEYNVRYLEPWRTPNDNGRLKVVHCGVDFSEIPERLEGREPGRLCTVGRLDPIKGFDVLLDALGILRREGIEFACTLIGEGELRPPLEAQRARLGLQDLVAMPGAQPQEVVRTTLENASIFVMPSVRTAQGNQDGIPVALMEAMASGAAVVSTRVSGIPELIEHEHSGLLVDPGDAEALATALRRLLQDDALRLGLGRAARARVAADFDAGIEARKLLAHMQSALIERAS